MKFRHLPAETPPGDYVQLWESEPAGRYRVAYVRMAFGFRCVIQFSRHPGDRWMGYEDPVYCCGAQHTALLLTASMVMKALEPFGEDQPPSETLAAFPRQQVKPLFNDPICWSRLCELAGVRTLSDLLLGDGSVEVERDVREAHLARQLGPPITCPRCGATSHNPHDKAFGWCGACDAFTTHLRSREPRDRAPADPAAP